MQAAKGAAERVSIQGPTERLDPNLSEPGALGRTVSRQDPHDRAAHVHDHPLHGPPSFHSTICAAVPPRRTTASTR